MKSRLNIDVSIDIEIALINKIIYEATIYGGDAGGSYCCNPEDLESAIKEWLLQRCLENKYYVDRDEYSHIQIKKFRNLAR